MTALNLTYMKQRSSLKYSAIFFVVMEVFLCNVTTLYADMQKMEQEKATEDNEKSNNNDTCLTPGCFNAATTILKNMDPNVKPCENFYEFACGGFLNSVAIPDGHKKIDVFSIYNDKIEQDLRVMYEAITARNQSKHSRLVKNLYDSCMNTSRIEADGPTPLKKILKKLGGWPVLEGEAWVAEDFDWMKTSSKFHDAGYSSRYIVSFNIDIDKENTSRRIIYLKHAHFDEHIVRLAANRSTYHRYMVDIAVYLGGKREEVQRELNSSLKFEIKLMNIALDGLENGGGNLEKTTLGQLVKNYSSIAWKEWFAALLPSTIILTENEPIVLKSPSYFTRLLKLLAKTPKRTVANYMFWRIVRRSIFYLNEQMRNRAHVFSSSIFGHSESLPRWQECVSIVTKRLPIGAGALYVKTYFNEEAKVTAVEITENIKNALKNIFKTVDWMDNATKMNALEKVDMMSSHVGYPDELLNETKVNEYYQDLELTGENYLESSLNLTLFATLKKYSLLQLPVDKDDWTFHADVAALVTSYSAIHNALIIPAGVLQGIYLSTDRPRYMNYGGIGSIIGHEVIHGFDDVGTQYDKNGHVVNWWDSATKANFAERAQCILEQYNNYIFELVGDNETDSEFTLSEDLADNGGFKQAYYAYITWADANKPEQSLPELPYTPRQMFWISLANMWCTKFRPEAQDYFLMEDEHSLDEFRVIGALSNFAEFSKDFNCPVGSRMNPVDKCVIW